MNIFGIINEVKNGKRFTSDQTPSETYGSEDGMLLTAYRKEKEPWERGEILFTIEVYGTDYETCYEEVFNEEIGDWDVVGGDTCPTKWVCYLTCKTNNAQITTASEDCERAIAASLSQLAETGFDFNAIYRIRKDGVEC